MWSMQSLKAKNAKKAKQGKIKSGIGVKKFLTVILTLLMVLQLTLTPALAWADEGADSESAASSQALQGDSAGADATTPLPSENTGDTGGSTGGSTDSSSSSNTDSTDGTGSSSTDAAQTALDTTGATAAEATSTEVTAAKAEATEAASEFAPTEADTVATTAGFFYLAASLATSGMLIEPVRVDYAAGDTIAAAIARRGLPITVSEGKYITAVAGTGGGAGSFTASAYGPGVSAQAAIVLNTNPETLSGGLLYIVSGTATYTVPSKMVNLVEQILRYKASTPAQSYAAAQAAYGSATSRFFSLLSDSVLLDSIIGDLQSAITAAETEYDNADTEVSFVVSNGDAPLQPADLSIRITNTSSASGTTRSVENNTIMLPQGNYSYEVYYAAEHKRATGSFVAAGESLTVTVAYPGEAYWLSALWVSHGTSSVPTQTILHGTTTAGSAVDYVTRSYLLDSKVVQSTSLGNIYFTATMAPSLVALGGTTIRFTPPGVAAVTVTSGVRSTTFYSYVKMTEGSAPADLNLRVNYTNSSTGIAYSQDYVHTIDRIRSLAQLTVSVDGDTIYSQEPAITGGTITVPASTTEIVVSADARVSYNDGNTVYADAGTGAALLGSGETITLPFSENSKTLSFAVENSDGTSSSGLSYDFTFERAANQETYIKVDTDATLVLTNSRGFVVTPTDETLGMFYDVYTYALNTGETYSYIAKKATTSTTVFRAVLLQVRTRNTSPRSLMTETLSNTSN